MDYPFEAWAKQPAKAGFFISGERFLRTRVYIDGYNLYYGCLKGTSLKWLDVCTLFGHHIIPSSSPSSYELTPLAVKYFTAPILLQAARAVDSLSCQEQYHSALRKHGLDTIEIIRGYYDLKPVTARQVDAANPKKWIRDCTSVDVWKLEEKQSDVNLAIHLVKDALLGEVDQVVVVTNDTDLAPALEMIRQMTPVQIGLVVPTTNHQRRPNEGLAKQAHWVRTHITTQELKLSQLPRVVTKGKVSATKPLSWYGHSDVLAQVLALGIIELKSNAAVFKWLSRPNPYLDNATPLQIIEDGQGARILEFMTGWALKRLPQD